MNRQSTFYLYFCTIFFKNYSKQLQCCKVKMPDKINLPDDMQSSHINSPQLLSPLQKLLPLAMFIVQFSVICTNLLYYTLPDLCYCNGTYSFAH